MTTRWPPLAERLLAWDTAYEHIAKRITMVADPTVRAAIIDAATALVLASEGRDVAGTIIAPIDIEVNDQNAVGLYPPDVLPDDDEPNQWGT